MLQLTTSSDRLRVITESSGTIHVSAHHVDYLPNAPPVPGRTNTIITTATTTDVMSGPSPTHFRGVKALSIRNVHATLSCAVSVAHYDGSTSVTLVRSYLLPGESIQLDEDTEWHKLDANASDANGYISVYANLASFPAVGVEQRLYVAEDTNNLYIWNGSAYVNVGGGGGGTPPPGNGYVQGSVGASASWLKYLVNDDGDIMTDAAYQIVHENDLGGADVPHSKFTITEGIHGVVWRIYASAAARTGDTTLVAADVQKCAWQSDNNTLWMLTNHSPVTWRELTNSGISTVTVIEDTIPATINDYNPGGTFVSDQLAGLVALNPGVSGTYTITGLLGGVDGRHVVIYNRGTLAADLYVLTHEDVASSGGARFSFPGGISFVVPNRCGIALVYDGTSGVWRPTGGQVKQFNVGSGANTVASGGDFRFLKNASSFYDNYYEWEPHRITVANAGMDPFVMAAILTGVFNSGWVITDAMADGRNLPVTIRSSASANSGGYILTQNLNIVLFPSIGWVYRCRFMMDSTTTNRTVRMGFHDTVSSADAVDGAYVEISSGTLKGKGSANSVRTTTATSFTYAALVYYTLSIYVEGTDNVTFDLTDDTGASVWSEYLALSTPDNLPELVARAMGCGIVATCSAVSSNICVVSKQELGTPNADTQKVVG